MCAMRFSCTCTTYIRRNVLSRLSKQRHLVPKVTLLCQSFPSKFFIIYHEIQSGIRISSFLNSNSVFKRRRKWSDFCCCYTSSFSTLVFRAHVFLVTEMCSREARDQLCCQPKRPAFLCPLFGWGKL